MKNKKPAIRFKGFSEEWEEKELKDICSIVTKQTGFDYSATIKPSLKKESSNETYSFIQNKDFNGTKIKLNTDFYIPKDIADTFPNILIDKPSILISISGKIGNVGFYNQIEKAFIGGAVGICKLIDESDGFIALYELLSNIGQNYFQSLTKASSHANITVEDIRKILLNIPTSKTEKTQIGNFFKNLDNLITLHQRKYDKLGVLKKAMLEKMFPKNGANVPEIRFKGFSEAWEERKLGEILTEMRRSIVLEDNKIYELVTVKRRNQGVVSRGLMKGKDILVKNYFEVREGDYIISKRQVIHGANGIVPKSLDRAIVSNEYLVCVENETMTAEYLTIISNLPDMYKKFFLSSYGVDIEKLVFDVEDWKKRSIVIPPLTEQKRITGFFKNLDDLLRLHDKELEKLKKLKKALLEKMFV